MDLEFLPNLIIAGVIRGATTSLYTYLSWHPNVCASAIKETDYFMPLVYGGDVEALSEYSRYFKHYNKAKHKYIMEASPRYFCGGPKLIRTIYECLGPTKIIILLRDPITRLFSHYQYLKKFKKFEKRLANLSFKSYVNLGLEELISIQDNHGEYLNVHKQNIFAGGVITGLYIEYLNQWYSVFEDSIKVCFFEHLKSDPLLFMRELCDWLGIDTTVYNSREFSIENRNITPRIKFLNNIAELINKKFEIFFRSHHRVKRLLRYMYCVFNEATRKDGLITEDTHKQLESLYAPYNYRLVQLLSFRGYSNFPNWLKKYS